MNHLRLKRFIPKKYRKRFIAIVLLTLVHNFIVFPAQASQPEDYQPVPATIGQKTIIKNPDSQERALPRLIAAKQIKEDNKPSIVSTFKLAKKQSDFHIGLIEEENNGTAVPVRGSERIVSMTAYNSEPAQTDGDPCTTANGFNVCEHGVEDTVAANFLPFGSKIMIPDLFPGKVFIVRDRMAARYTNRVDIWMLNRGDALKFGVRKAKIVILES